MKKEVNLIISIIFMALGVDYIIEGYKIAFVLFEMFSLFITVSNNEINYKKVSKNVLILFILLNIISSRVGLNAIFDLFILNNLFIALNTAIWIDIINGEKLYNSIVMKKIMFACNSVFILFVLLTILLGGKYFLYPNNLPTTSEIVMIVLFTIMFEPIVIANSVLKFISEINSYNKGTISIQNVLK